MKAREQPLLHHLLRHYLKEEEKQGARRRAIKLQGAMINNRKLLEAYKARNFA
jgi:hypothetical protein